MKYLLIILFCFGLSLYIIITNKRLKALEQIPKDHIILTIDQYKLLLRGTYEEGREDGFFNKSKNLKQVDSIALRKINWDKTSTDTLLWPLGKSDSITLNLKK